jgi:HAD superfamily hydrolase (TIGR01549 family)
VILDSNNLKIEAMRKALLFFDDISEEDVLACTDYFKNNFGKSRYHHIRYFVDNLLNVPNKEEHYAKILKSYADSCFTLYLTAAEAHGIRSLLEKPEFIKFVASGSDQEELRKVFEIRKLSPFFNEIFGSPEKKTEIVNRICCANTGKRIVMIGDAVSDFEAAKENKIDFIFYAPYSNVKDTMLSLNEKEKFLVCNSFQELTK